LGRDFPGTFPSAIAFTTAYLMNASIVKAEPAKTGAARLRFSISFPEAAAKTPLDGRLLLILSTNDAKEPRFQNGDHSRPNAISRLRYHQMHAPKIVERILKSAPPGVDLTSWRY